MAWAWRGYFLFPLVYTHVPTQNMGNPPELPQIQCSGVFLRILMASPDSTSRWPRKNGLDKSDELDKARKNDTGQGNEQGLDKSSALGRTGQVHRCWERGLDKNWTSRAGQPGVGRTLDKLLHSPLKKVF
eukprot:gene15619-biopygen17192